MSMSINICCSMCGRDIFRMLTDKEIRDGKEVEFGGFHLIPVKGKQQEICDKCYTHFKDTLEDLKEEVV